MTPSWWQFTLLALAAYRVTRLIGWDIITQPVRTRLVWDSEAETYKRPLVDEFLRCPFCSGAWISILVYLAWLWEPRKVMYAAVPLAISAVVGLVAKQLDA